MFFIYNTLINILILISPIIVLLRIINNKEDKIRFKEKYCIFSKKKRQRKFNMVSWFKCW